LKIVHTSLAKNASVQEQMSLHRLFTQFMVSHSMIRVSFIRLVHGCINLQCRDSSRLVHGCIINHIPYLYLINKIRARFQRGAPAARYSFEGF
jgi:hypothetical protein